MKQSKKLLFTVATALCLATVATRPIKKDTDADDNAAQKALHQAQMILGGLFKDQRNGSGFEQNIAYFVYAPLVVLFLVINIGIAYPVGKRFWRFWSGRKGDVRQEDIDLVDGLAMFDYSMADLNKYNMKRGENKLNLRNLVYAHHRLNNRTEFEIDDVFSQKTVCSCIIKKMEQKYISQHEEIGTNWHINKKIIASEVTGSLLEIEPQQERQLTKAWNLQRDLQSMCILSLVTTTLALGQIFTYLLMGERVFVLTTFENLLMRTCFIGVIMLIGVKDINQVLINMQVRITGAMNLPENSRWAMVEYFIRMTQDILAQITICFMVVTTPKGEDEDVVTQTMNFTALVILLQIDNILGGMYSKKVEFFNMSFEYDKEKAEEEFNKCCDFMQARSKRFYIQEFFESIINFILFFALFAIFFFTPIAYLMCYIIIPVGGKAPAATS